MKNLLHVIGGLDRGGAESFLMNTIRNLDRKKFNIIIATFMPPINGKKYAHQDELDKLGIKVVSIEDNRFSKPLNFISDIRKLASAENIDILHSHIDFMSALTLIGAQQAGVKKRIAHSHNTNNSQLNSLPKKMISVVLRRFINIFATDKVSCGHDAGRFLFGKNSKFIFIPNGIDTKKFKYSKDFRTRLRTKYKINTKSTILLNVGRLEEQKNQSFLIDVFHNYHTLNPDSFLFIIGDGSQRAALENKISRLKLTKNTFLIPSLPNIHEYYSAADYFLLPSLFEGIPIVGIEAQSNGLKCLFSSHTPKETKLSDRVLFLDIDGPDDDKKWSEKITNPNSETIRTQENSDPKISSYDISKTIIKLERVYDSK